MSANVSLETKICWQQRGFYIDAFTSGEHSVPSTSNGGTLEDVCEEDRGGAADNVAHHHPTNSSESLLDTQFVDVERKDRGFCHHEGRVVESRESVRKLSSHLVSIFLKHPYSEA